jgi:AraC-like DNA-binding protein
MQITFNWLVVLMGVVIAQSLFAAGLLFFSRQNMISNRLLSVLIIVIALWLSDDFMRLAGIYQQRPNLYFLPIFYSFSFGPFIWFYVRSLIRHPFRLTRIDLLHFIPVTLQTALYLFLCFSPYSFKYWYWEHVHRAYTYRVEFDGTWVSLMVYLLLSFRQLRHYQVWVVNHFSEVSRIRLNWLKVLLAILIVLCVQWFIEILLRDFGGLYFNYDYSVEILGVAVLVLGIAGIRQASLSDVHFEAEEPAKAVFLPDPLVLKAISDGMEKQQLYLNPTLTLVQLASVLKLNPKIVSRHINTGFQKSFNDYVNAYRIDEVKRRLKSSDLEKLTILGIAYDSGFNSKTTFNRIFREFTGMAPSDFIAQ